MVIPSRVDGISAGIGATEDEADREPDSLVAPSDALDMGPDSEIIPRKRGLPLKETLRGALSRFLPSSILSLSAVTAIIGSIFPLGEFLLGVLIVSGMLTLGFGAGLEGLRRWLYPDAGVDGRRSIVAGLMAPLALFIPLLFQGVSEFLGMSVLFIVGVAMAVGMFFPWLTATPGSDDVGYGSPVESEEDGSLLSGGTKQGS